MWITSMGNHGVVGGISECRCSKCSSYWQVCLFAVATNNDILEKAYETHIYIDGTLSMGNTRWTVPSVCFFWTHWSLTKWPPLCRWHSQMHFFSQEDVSYFTSNLLTFVPNAHNHNESALVKLMAWHLTGAKPLTEPMMTQFTDEYIHHNLKI